MVLRSAEYRVTPLILFETQTKSNKCHEAEDNHVRPLVCWLTMNRDATDPSKKPYLREQRSFHQWISFFCIVVMPRVHGYRGRGSVGLVVNLPTDRCGRDCLAYRGRSRTGVTHNLPRYEPENRQIRSELSAGGIGGEKVEPAPARVMARIHAYCVRASTRARGRGRLWGGNGMVALPGCLFDADAVTTERLDSHSLTTAGHPQTSC